MVKIRQMCSEDFSFVQELASEEQTFTVPSDYILWMFCKLYPEVCLVATDSDNNLLGYLLAAINGQKNNLFVWQIAVTHRGSAENAAIKLGEYSKSVMQLHGLTSLSCTMQPRIAKLWGYRAAKKIFGILPEQCGEGINGELEFIIRI